MSEQQDNKMTAKEMREIWETELRISKSGYSVKCGDRIVAQFHLARKPFTSAEFKQWMDDADKLCDGWNALFGVKC